MQRREESAKEGKAGIDEREQGRQDRIDKACGFAGRVSGGRAAIGEVLRFVHDTFCHALAALVQRCFSVGGDAVVDVAVRWRNSGVPLFEIGRGLGHSQLATTTQYAHHAHYAPERLVAMAATAALARGLPTGRTESHSKAT